MKARRITIAAILVIQVLCAVFFIGEIAISVFGLSTTPIDWRLYETIEIGAALGLVLGVVVGAMALRQAWRRGDRAEAALANARSAFAEMARSRFEEWGLTPAETDVAFYSIKGMSISEMAELRGVSEGTIKAQTAAIYRKAGVSGRAQLVSVFVDDLIDAEQPSG